LLTYPFFMDGTIPKKTRAPKGPKGPGGSLPDTSVGGGQPSKKKKREAKKKKRMQKLKKGKKSPRQEGCFFMGLPRGEKNQRRQDKKTQGRENLENGPKGEVIRNGGLSFTKRAL